MRKNRERPYGSPKFKLQSKSPAGKQKLKISSPIHSPKSNQTSQVHLIKSQQTSSQRKTVWLPNPTLYSFIHPLQKFQSVSLTFTLSITNKNMGQKIWVISNIDFFIDTYMQLNQQLKVECQKWYIISNAVNCKETETEFNKLYQPIQFIFLPNISNLCNCLLNFSECKRLADIKAIYDLSLAYSTQYMCIQDAVIESIVNPEPKCLYILSDAKQWMLFSTKINKALIPYFLTGTQQFKDGKLNVHDFKEKEKTQMFYILFQFEKNLSQLKGFQEYETNFINQTIRPIYMTSISDKSEIYLSKIVDKVLIPRKHICLFYESLSRSSLLNIKEIRQRLSMEYYLLEYKFYKEEDTCFKLKWNGRVRSCQQLAINTAVSLNDQINKIESFINEKQFLLKQFTRHVEKFKKMQIFFYNKDKTPYHCIMQMLKCSNIKVNIILNLENLYETHKITLIYGNLTFNEIKQMKNFYNVFVVPISKEPEEVATFNQLLQAQQFIQTGLKAYQQLYIQINSQTVEAFVHTLYESETQLHQLLKSLIISENILKTHYIPNLKVALGDFRQFSKHLIISDMNSFSEELEQMIREVQWRWNTISIEVYIRYGNEFILRNKEGSYKFIKAAELQSKITELEQCYRAEQAKNLVPNQNIPEPVLHVLPQVENIMGSDGQLDDLVPEESIVELYVGGPSQQSKSIQQIINKSPIFQQRNEYYSHSIEKQKTIQKIGQTQNENSNSIIQILSESSIKQKQKTTPVLPYERDQNSNNYYQLPKKVKNQVKKSNKKQSMVQFLGEETMQLLDQQITPYFQKRRSKKGENIKNSLTDPSSSLKVINEQNKNVKQNSNKKAQRRDQEQCKIHSTSKNKKIKEKGAYIKQYKQYQHQPLKMKANDDQEINFVWQASSANVQIYKLYIFIHRSVPHHSLARRQSKEYHILLYTKLEQILAFARYLKAEQKIVLIANEQSSKVYGQLVQKSGIKEEKLRIIFGKDLSENFIRRQIDNILKDVHLQQAKREIAPSKKFKALVVYATNNERVMKSIKIIRKIFGTQLKLLFLKEKQFQEMNESKFKLKINSDISIYKIGLNPKKNEVQLTSIRNLFILAMHPDLKSPTYDFSELQFSFEAYMGRLVYGKNEKNYIMTGDKMKTRSDSFRKKIQEMKSEGNLLVRQDSRLSYLKTEHSDRRKSNTPKHSSISRSSTLLLRQSSKISIIVSYALQQFYNSKNIFTSESALYQMIFACHSFSKLAIVIITQKQFDIFQIFQSRKYQELTREVIWVIETKTEGKKLFVGSNIVYATAEDISQAIETIVQQYENQINFQSLEVESGIDAIKNGKYSQHDNRLAKSITTKSLTVVILPNGPLVQRQLANQIKQKPKIIATVQKQNKSIQKYTKNLIYFPNVQAMKIFIQALSGRFLGRGQLQPYHSFGSLILVPQSHIEMVAKSSQQAGIKNILFRTYDHQNLCELASYSLLRSLILLDRDNPLKALEKSPYTVNLQRNQQKMGKLLAATLL